MNTTKYIKTFAVVAATVLCLGATTSCDDGKSYAELLEIETHHVNDFLADHRVCMTIPPDSTFNFETGADAPYYRLDVDGNAYMQVINPGTPGNYAEADQIIYFRFTRYNLNYYTDGVLPDGEGNETDMTYLNAWFRFDNLGLQSSYQWGSGVQLPLKYLPVDCEVNIVIKSQLGFYDEQAYVQPYLFKVRYYPQQT